MDEPAETSFVRIGDLASSVGLSVRALRHYEDIGLIEPSTRSAAGHRLYAPDVADRLYRVCMLRGLGLSLDQVGRALDGPDWSVEALLERHVQTLDTQINNLTGLRATVGSVLANGASQSADLLRILEEMTMTDSQLTNRISILVYADLQAAYDYLVDVFGLTPGEITEHDGTIHLAQLFAGDGEIWLHPESPDFKMASPQTAGSSTAMVAVMVADVDDHFALVKAKGAEIVYEPVDQPYGYREYSARDNEGGMWSFMKPLD